MGTAPGTLPSRGPVLGKEKARSMIDMGRCTPGPVAAVVWLMGRLSRPRAAEVHWGTRPLATATSTMITNLDHLLSVVTGH